MCYISDPPNLRLLFSCLDDRCGYNLRRHSLSALLVLYVGLLYSLVTYHIGLLHCQLITQANSIKFMTCPLCQYTLFTITKLDTECFI